MGLELFNTFILLLLVASALLALRVKDLITASVVFGVYSFLMCLLWAEMGAVDVAFTEAAVGAGISTVLFIGTLALTTRVEKKPAHKPYLPFIVVVITGAALIYGSFDMARFGDADAAANKHVAPYYLENTKKHTGIPNVVTAVLASYRGYDTLGEVTVIFTAGIGVILLLGSWRRGLSPPAPHKEAEA